MLRSIGKVREINGYNEMGIISMILTNMIDLPLILNDKMKQFPSGQYFGRYILFPALQGHRGKNNAYKLLGKFLGLACGFNIFKPRFLFKTLNQWSYIMLAHVLRSL